jgi:hypothetical protein
MVAAVITAVATFLLDVPTTDVRGTDKTVMLNQTVAEQARLITVLRAQIDSLRTTHGTINDSLRPQEIVILNERVTSFETRLNKIERVILSDPTKALDLVLVRRDLDELKTSNADNISAVRRDVDRIYDLSKWIIGLMFTMALGVLSLAAATIFKDRKSGDSKE